MSSFLTRLIFSSHLFVASYYVTREDEESEDLGGRNLEGDEEKRRGGEISRQVDNPYAHSSGVGREGSTKYRLLFAKRTTL